MDQKRLEILGREGIPIGYVEVLPALPSDGEYKIVIQLQRGFQVLALRSEMTAGRISGILGKAGLRVDPGAPPLRQTPAV